MRESVGSPGWTRAVAGGVWRAARWHLERRRAVVLLLAVAATVGAAPTVALPRLPLLFAACYAIAWVAVMAVARGWEASTWPPAEPFARRAAAASNQPSLRLDHNAMLFRDRGGFLFAPRVFFTATGLPPVQVPTAAYHDAALRQAEQPVVVAQTDARTWWWFEDAFHWESHGYQAQDVLALLRQRARQHDRRLERAHQALRNEQEPVARRSAIPRELRRAVFERDGGRCVQCDSSFDIQYDHVLPVKLGGATTLENLQILCAPCNQSKSANP